MDIRRVVAWGSLLLVACTDLPLPTGGASSSGGAPDASVWLSGCDRTGPDRATCLEPGAVCVITDEERCYRDAVFDSRVVAGSFSVSVGRTGATTGQSNPSCIDNDLFIARASFFDGGVPMDLQHRPSAEWSHTGCWFQQVDGMTARLVSLSPTSFEVNVETPERANGCHEEPAESRCDVDYRRRTAQFIAKMPE